MFRWVELLDENKKLRDKLQETVRKLLIHSQYDGIEEIRTDIRKTLSEVENESITKDEKSKKKSSKKN